MNDKNLLTKRQLSKQRKHRKIYDTFCAVRADNPNDTLYACLREVAKKFNCTVTGVQYAIRKWKEAENA